MHDKDQDRLRHSSSGNSCSVFLKRFLFYSRCIYNRNFIACGLTFLLRLETNGMELEMHTRSACRLGQTIEIDISVKSRWRCLAAARIQADLSYDNKMFQVNRNIPLALDINKRSFGISIARNRRCAEARSSALVMCAAMIFLA